jgi:hypothetical protein
LDVRQSNLLAGKTERLAKVINALLNVLKKNSREEGENYARTKLGLEV